MSRVSAKDALVLLISFAVATVLGELVLRICVAIQPQFTIAGIDPMRVQVEPAGAVGFRPRPHAVFAYGNGTSATTNAEGYRGPVVPQQPAPGTVRVVLLGGSNTYGWGVSDDQTIDAHMRRILPQRLPSVHFEIVNLAFDGYDSRQDLERLRADGLRLGPSVVIINDGPNDVKNAWFSNLTTDDPRTLIWEDVLRRLRDERAHGGPSLWTRVKHYSLLARVPGYLKEQLKSRRDLAYRARNKNTVAAPTPSAPAGGPPYPAAAVYFEHNVREMVGLSLNAGAAVVLATPPSGLELYAPTFTSGRAYWLQDAQTTQAYRDELDRRLRVIAAEEQGAGNNVRYVMPSLPKSAFLDDSHLTAEGNRLVATSLAEAVIAALEQGSRSTKVAALATRSDLRAPAMNR